MPDNVDKLDGKALMDAYRFVRIGSIIAPNPVTFSIEIHLTEALSWEKAIYIFVFNNEIVRVGSSKGRLGRRMKEWCRCVTNALHRVNGLPAKKTVTPDWEARGWSKLLNAHGSGEIYAREATEVTTPVGSFRAYMDEESILINRHKPKMNRHKNR
ncbi:MAG: hypothetical protein ACK502_06810 [Alphaproteobacteria bacterium]